MARPGNNIIQAKLVLVGDMGTGKTSLVLRFVKGQFFDNQEPTIGAAFFTQVLSLAEATVKFDIWDTAGQERYHSLAPMYYRGAAAAVVVYDISSMDTFTRAKKWVQELQRQGSQNLVMALVANKSDLDAKREVAIEEGEQFSQENGMFFTETSAKTSQNINELFFEIGKLFIGIVPGQLTILAFTQLSSRVTKYRKLCSIEAQAYTRTRKKTGKSSTLKAEWDESKQRNTR